MTFLSDANIIINALADYHQQSIAGQEPVINQVPLAQLITELELARHLDSGDLAGEELARFITHYLASATRLHRPTYMGHQVAVPHHAGALGALIDGFTNNPMAIYEMGPGAASIEYFVINWLLEKVGWQPAPLTISHDSRPTFGGGVLTHGGSLANLTALVAARSRLVPDVWRDGNPGDLALLAPAGSHYSIARAAGILGIGQRAIYELEVDERGMVRPDRLPAVYARLRNDGKRTVALVANAGSTAVGLYDPLAEIGAFCKEHELWFHVDGAHGASALLSERYRHLLSGVKLADSLVWDAHKLVRTPALCAAILVRDHRTLDAAFQQEASYLFHDKEQPGFDFIHRTVECTKAGLGLRLYMVLAALGERGLAEYIERQFELAVDVYNYIGELPDFECAVEPQSNILCFRLNGSDDLQLAIRARLIAQGDFYVSTTAFNGRRYIRLVLMNPDTTLAEVKRLIEAIRSLKMEILSSETSSI
jgi:L-2,4-diaminobutyrate decarboxylase